MMRTIGRVIWPLAAALVVSAAPAQEDREDVDSAADETQAPATPAGEEADAGSAAESERDPPAADDDDDGFVPTEELDADEEVTFPVGI